MKFERVQKNQRKQKSAIRASCEFYVKRASQEMFNGYFPHEVYINF